MDKYTCLILENDPLELDFVESVLGPMFQGKGKLWTCRDSIKAVRLAQEYEPDLILMDILVPGAEGMDILEQIREILPDCCISIVTNRAEFRCAQRAVSSRVFDYVLKPVRAKEMRRLISRMCREVDRIKEYGRVMQKSQELLKPPEAAEPEMDENRMKKALAYIEANFCEKLTLEQVAAEVYMNPQYFSRIFKKETGRTFSCYVMELRIRHACMLLKTTEYPAYRVAIECGFSEHSYFSRVFRVSMGMTPQAYRKCIKSQNSTRKTQKNINSCKKSE